MRCFQKSKQGIEVNYYELWQDGDGSIFGMFLHDPTFPSCADYHLLLVLPLLIFLFSGLLKKAESMREYYAWLLLQVLRSAPYGTLLRVVAYLL